MIDKSTIFISTNQFYDVEASLTLLDDALEKVSANEAYWKAIVIFTHLALQGACVCLLTHSDSSGPFDKKTEKEIRRYNDIQSQMAVNEAYQTPWEIDEPQWPEEKLASLVELMERMPSGLGERIKSNPNECKTDLAKAISFVLSLRNTFAHMTPTSWLIRRDQIIRSVELIILHVLKVIKSDEYNNRNQFPQTKARVMAQSVLHKLERLKAHTS